MSIEEQEQMWMAQGDEDLRKARILYENDAYDGAVTFAQQAAEKFLKALWLVRFQRTPPRAHDLERLAMDLGAPTDIAEMGKLLTEGFPKSRYLNATGGVPPYLYLDAATTRERINQAERIREWVRQECG